MTSEILKNNYDLIRSAVNTIARHLEMQIIEESLRSDLPANRTDLPELEYDSAAIGDLVRNTSPNDMAAILTRIADNIEVIDNAMNDINE